MNFEVNFNILLFTFLGSIFSLAGGLALIYWKQVKIDVILLLVSFAAGVLLGAAFLDLLPEALEHSEELGLSFNLFLWVLVGIAGFYILDRAIHWYTHHQRINKGKHGTVSIPLVVFGDSLHNFVDGIAIAITFMANPALGITT